MTLKETVNKDFIQARKDKDTLKADVLRLIKTEYDSFIIDNKREMTEAEEITRIPELCNENGCKP
jgi:uncharacterized protein YqeY